MDAPVNNFWGLGQLMLKSAAQLPTTGRQRALELSGWGDKGRTEVVELNWNQRVAGWIPGVSLSETGPGQGALPGRLQRECVCEQSLYALKRRNVKNGIEPSLQDLLG